MSNHNEINEPTLIPRRDILKAAWAAPVVLAITPSLNIVAGSTNNNFQGLTPGFWRQIEAPHDQHLDNWYETNYTPDDEYDQVFGITTSFGSGATLGYTVQAKGGGENALARHATAAILNATSPDINYPYTEAQIIGWVQAAYAANDPAAIETLKDKLAAANELEL